MRKKGAENDACYHRHEKLPVEKDAVQNHGDINQTIAQVSDIRKQLIKFAIVTAIYNDKGIHFTIDQYENTYQQKQNKSDEGCRSELTILMSEKQYQSFWPKIVSRQKLYY